MTSSQFTWVGLALAESAAILAQEFAPSQAANYALWAPRLALSPPSIAGTLLATAGGLLRIWCYRTLGTLFTWEVQVRDDHKLITSGPYAIVRHPGYLGTTLLVIGNSLMLWTPGSVFVEAGWRDTVVGKVSASVLVVYLAWITVGFWRRMSLEDALMKKRFGAQWEEWARRTPCRLIPFIY